MEGIKINLSSLAIEITNICNFKCKMCIKQSDYYKEWYKKVPKNMTMDLFKKIINEYKNLKNNIQGGILLQFQGESLTKKDFLDYCKYVNDSKIDFGFTTNGSLLTKEMTNKLLKFKHFTSISFSIDGYTKETFEKIRVGSNRDIVYENVKYFLSQSSIIKGDTFGTINIVSMEENKHEIEKIVDYWFKNTTIRKITNSNVTDENIIPTKFNFTPERLPCLSPFTSMIVLTNGKVVACCRDSKYELDLGNLSNETLEDIWYGEKYNNLRDTQINEKWDNIHPCNNCYSWGGRVKEKKKIKTVKHQNFKIDVYEGYLQTQWQKNDYENLEIATIPIEMKNIMKEKYENDDLLLYYKNELIYDGDKNIKLEFYDNYFTFNGDEKSYKGIKIKNKK